MRAYLDVVAEVRRFEPVIVLADPSTAKEARSRLGRDMEVIEIELDDSWLRDNSPVYVRNCDSRVAIVKFGFDAWGNKSPHYDRDDRVPITLAKLLRAGFEKTRSHWRR